MRENLKSLRIKKDLPVGDLAVMLGISQSFYYKIESGARNPTILLAKQIANFFNADMEQLFFNQPQDDVSNDKANTHGQLNYHSRDFKYKMRG